MRGICIEDKKIKVVCNALEPWSSQDIQMFLKFANFYSRFIRDLSLKIAPLIFLLPILSCLAANKLIFMDRIYEISGG